MHEFSISRGPGARPRTAGSNLDVIPYSMGMTFTVLYSERLT
jgi:hypothetical protein